MLVRPWPSPCESNGGDNRLHPTASAHVRRAGHILASYHRISHGHRLITVTAWNLVGADWSKTQDCTNGIHLRVQLVHLSASDSSTCPSRCGPRGFLSWSLLECPHHLPHPFQLLSLKIKSNVKLSSQLQVGPT